MDLRDYLAVLRKRLVSILILTALGLATAVAATAATPSTYSATAQNFIAITDSGAVGSDALQSAAFAQQRVKSYTLIVSSPDVVVPVVSELNLSLSPAALAGKVSATNPPLTVLLDVTATDGNPQTAAEIANAVSIQLGKVIEQLETPATAVTAPVKVTLVKPATPPTAPSSPRKTINYVIGLIVGLGIGVAWAFTREALDNSVNSPTKLEELLQVPNLGLVLQDSKSKTRRLVATDATSVESEGYRTIRTNLEFVNIDNPPKVMVVSSPTPGDGKSTTSCNLAITLAYAGHSVALVDADLRRPRIVEYLDLPSSAGLTDVLAGRATVDACLVPWGRGLISVLPCGPIPPNPSELVASEHMATILEDLRNRFDFVIVDASPLLAVADAAVLAARADGALLVVRYGKSTRDQVRLAGETLDRVSAKLLGTIMNAVPIKRGGYGYGYGYGYGEANSEKNPGLRDPQDPPAGTTPAAAATSGEKNS